ncbi:MAG: hypothetical protein ACFFDK_00470 [Promethearchaeota archaeon]
MVNMRCCICGNKIETIPVHCGEDMIYNEQTNQWECYMGPECGYIKLDKLFCSRCADFEC